MKKIILTLFVGGLVLTSCKKDFTCECSVTETSTLEGSSAYTYTTKTTAKDTNKKAIKNQGFCVSSVDSYTSEKYVGIGPDGTPTFKTVTETTTSDCKFSK